jgi:Sulfatase
VRAPAVVLLVVLIGAAVAFAVDADHDELAAADVRPPIVVIVFDEFPTESLTTPSGEIDAVRYPNFAALAKTSTWFRNGYTIFDSTFKALPSILDGRMPADKTAADVRSHQPSVYHLMHRLGYDIVKVESATAVCPPWICEGTRTRRPGVLPRLAGRGRPARLHRWIGAIRDRDRPAFYFHHALLPHEPWLYLPSGRRNRPPGNDPIPGINKPHSFDDRELTLHNHLRHLLQVGYVDLEIGRLLRRLRRTRLLDEALIAVVADHGYSFALNVDSRRLVTPSNVEEIAPVPFFVKSPGQTEGKVDRSLVRTVDVVPTIAELLGTEVHWRHDGVSVFSRASREREFMSLRTRDFSRLVRIGPDALERRRAANRRRWADLYGTGASSEAAFGDPWAEAYRIGPHPELLDTPVSSLTVLPGEGIQAEVRNGSLVANVSTSGDLIPTRVTGRLFGVPPGRERDLAVAVNGRIRALTRSFHLWRASREYYSMLVPESALRDGFNRLELFEVRDGHTLVPLNGP